MVPIPVLAVPSGEGGEEADGAVITENYWPIMQMVNPEVQFTPALCTPKR